MFSMIDRALAGFLEAGLSIHIGVRDAHLQPSGARAAAVSVEPDGGHMLVYVPDLGASRILPDLEATGQAAVSFGRPTDDRACQVKGIVTSIRQATADERAIITAQWQGFMRQLETIGIPRDVTLGWATWPAVVVRLRVTAVFEQTPGPLAGTPLA
jgi:hypothetical protein